MALVAFDRNVSYRPQAVFHVRLLLGRLSRCQGVLNYHRNMQLTSGRHEDAELRALSESGTDVSYAGETLTFLEGDRTLVFEIDELTPAYATFATIATATQSQSVKLGTAFGSNAIQFPYRDALVSEALRYLSEQRDIRFIAIYDGPSGGFKRFPVVDLQ